MSVVNFWDAWKVIFVSPRLHLNQPRDAHLHLNQRNSLYASRKHAGGSVAKVHDGLATVNQ